MALRIGGADTHRFSLGDMVLIKDNHIASVGDPLETLLKAKKNVSFSKKIEIEVESIGDAIDCVLNKGSSLSSASDISCIGILFIKISLGLATRFWKNCSTIYFSTYIGAPVSMARAKASDIRVVISCLFGRFDGARTPGQRQGEEQQ